MNGDWTEAVNTRLEQDEDYRSCKQAEEELHLKLIALLSEEQKEVYLDFLCAQVVAGSMEHDHIYAVGWSNGRRSKK